MKVPLVDVNAQNAPFQEEFRAKFRAIAESGQFLLGPYVEEFEKAVARRYGFHDAIAVSSGTDALVVALLALGIGPGDEVICPSFTFYATAGAVTQVGATPVFADVCPICHNLDVATAEPLVTARTKALIPVHLFGQSADMDAVKAFASQHGLAIIEDAAQAMGAQYRGQACGGMGDLGTFSFYPTKNLGALGDAGMVVTNNAVLAEKVRMVRVHGSRERYRHEIPGGNFRLDALQGAALSVKLQALDHYEQKRSSHAATLTAGLQNQPGVVIASEKDCGCPVGTTQRTSQAPQITLPVAYSHHHHVWNQYTIRVHHGRREALKTHLRQAGIASEVYYPIPVHQQPCYAHLPKRTLAWSEQLSQEVLSLPVYPELSDSQLEAIVEAVKTFL